MARGSVWSHGGIICTGETYKAVVKMTFAKGAALEDPAEHVGAGAPGRLAEEGQARVRGAVKRMDR